MTAPRAELTSLLAAARLSPHDNTPRLIIADWLEENGDAADQARAAFVRSQVKRAARQKFGKRRLAHSREEQRLLTAHRSAWLGGLDNLSSSAEIGFVRGLVDLRIDAEALLARPARAVLESEAAAWLDEVTLCNINTTRLRRVLALPVATWFGGLILPSSGITAVQCRVIAECERLAGLHTLDLDYNSIGDDGAAALAESPYLGAITHLDLWICGIGAEGVRALAESPTLGRPDWLNLGGNTIGEDGARALAASPILENLRRLLLWGNGIGSAGIEALLAAPQLGPLEELYLNENGLGLPGARALARWAGLAGVKTLSLWGNSLRTRGGAALCEAPMSAMRMLLLANAGLGDAGARAIAGNPTLRRLEQLDLSSNGITDDGARAILESPHLGKLTNLNLNGNRVGQALSEALEERFDTDVHDEVP